jgi:hypothetical protein
METNVITKKLQQAVETQSEVATEEALKLVFGAEAHSDFVPFLVQLLEVECHFRHEDIARLLQMAKDNRATRSLLRTAQRKFEYLSYDNSYALARKCTWALADIGTSESKDALLELASSGDSIIAEYAKRRIDKWEEELNRKNAANKLS